MTSSTHSTSTTAATEAAPTVDTLAARLRDGTVPEDAVADVGRRLATFHATAPAVRDAPDPRIAADRALEGLVSLAHGIVPTREILAVRRFTEAFLLGWQAVLAGRAASGRVVDGHGDLRAENVLLLPVGDVVVPDRLAGPARRALDVADDLASLTTDLEALGGGEVAAELLRGYADGGGEVPPAELLAYFGSVRAAARAKVALTRGTQDTGRAADADEARRLLALGRRLAARARGENVLLVTGPPASGKTTLARALGDATGLTVLSPTAVREETGTTGYDLATRTRVYAELGRRAARLRACIVEATFGEPALRRAFLGELDREHRRRVLAVECHARPATLAERARSRAAGTTAGAGVDAEVARRLAESFTPFDELDPGDRLGVNAEDAPDRLVDAVEGWLDGHLATGRLG